jgi:hypothetical protein
MKRATKKEIKAAVEKLKENNSNASGAREQIPGKLPPKHSSQRIRKQGV